MKDVVVYKAQIIHDIGVIQCWASMCNGREPLWVKGLSYSKDFLEYMYMKTRNNKIGQIPGKYLREILAGRV